MAIYQNVKIFDYYEANRSAKSELAAQELLDFLLNEKDISIMSGNTVIGFVQEKQKIGNTIRATIYISSNFLKNTASEDYRIHEYEIIRGAGGDMVCLHIEPSNKPSFWDKIKYKLNKKQPKVEDITPSN